MPERQQGVLRWVVLVIVLAVFVGLILAKTDETDDGMLPIGLATAAAAPPIIR